MLQAFGGQVVALHLAEHLLLVVVGLDLLFDCRYKFVLASSFLLFFQAFRFVHYPNRLLGLVVL